METREVLAGPIGICCDGHVAQAGEAVLTTQFLASCGHWNFLDANYCERCARDVRDETRPQETLNSQGVQ